MTHVFQEPDEIAFNRAGVIGKIFPAEAVTDKADFLLIETDQGHETTIVEQECLFVYYVLNGQGYFEIEDKREDCRAGDLIVIPAGKKFTYKGKLRMLLMNTPKWSSEQEVVEPAQDKEGLH